MGNGFSFERVETGRTDTTPQGVQKISDSDGNPEAEYVFYADVEGAKVPLFSKPATFIDGIVKSQQRAQQQQQSQQQPAEGTASNAQQTASSSQQT